jgi:hypothetical protein
MEMEGYDFVRSIVKDLKENYRPNRQERTTCSIFAGRRQLGRTVGSATWFAKLDAGTEKLEAPIGWTWRKIHVTMGLTIHAAFVFPATGNHQTTESRLLARPRADVNCNHKHHGKGGTLPPPFSFTHLDKMKAQVTGSLFVSSRITGFLGVRFVFLENSAPL